MLTILVCIKQVPSTTHVQLDEDHSLVRDTVTQVINPADEAALEFALQIKQRHGAMVTVMTMGKKSADNMLRETASRGADRLILLHDKAFGGADTLATAKTLKKAVDKAGPFDLIFCGRRAIDGETGQVGPELAALLDAAVVTNGTNITLLPKGGAQVSQLTDTGNALWFCPEFPLVVTFYERCVALRLPTIVGLRKGKKAQINLWGREELDMDKEECGLSGSPTRVVGVRAEKTGFRQCDWVTVPQLFNKGVLKK